MSRSLARFGVILLLLVGLSACGSSSESSRSTTPTNRAAALTGNLNVLAAASLTESFDEFKGSLAGDAPGLTLTLNYAGSQALVQQIQDGAPADVFASADQKNMQKLVDAGLVEQPTVFVRNRLEIAVAPGNPKKIHGLADLARSDVIVVLDDPAVPAGNYTQLALTKAGVTVRPKSLELDVKAALARVTSGEADATVVYQSDVKAAKGQADGVVIRDDQNVIAKYPIAVLKSSSNKKAARAFVKAVLSQSGQLILRTHGFLTAG